jgi:hypothetical protein
MTTNVLNTSFFFGKEVVNSAAVQEKPPLPKDYPGVQGSSLLERAPKIKK